MTVGEWRGNRGKAALLGEEVFDEAGTSSGDGGEGRKATEGGEGVVDLVSLFEENRRRGSALEEVEADDGSGSGNAARWEMSISSGEKRGREGALIRYRPHVSVSDVDAKDGTARIESSSSRRLVASEEIAMKGQDLVL